MINIYNPHTFIIFRWHEEWSHLHIIILKLRRVFWYDRVLIAQTLKLPTWAVPIFQGWDILLAQTARSKDPAPHWMKPFQRCFFYWTKIYFVSGMFLYAEVDAECLSQAAICWSIRRVHLALILPERDVWYGGDEGPGCRYSKEKLLFLTFIFKHWEEPDEVARASG